MESCESIRAIIGDFRPELAIVLGSGLGGFGDRIHVDHCISYSDIPHFMPCHVAGHSGNLLFGTIRKKKVVCQQGRYHYYEGHDPQHIVHPIRVMSQLGAGNLLVTNAAGGICEGFVPGDIMLIRDHINFMGMNPLRGTNPDGMGTRFPDMSYAYNSHLSAFMLEAALETHVFLREGVYLAVPGPSYETPAEIRMFRTLGADAVGMSTVPEVIAAVHAGMQVVGLSCISNVAAGLTEQVLAHDHVAEVVGSAGRQFEDLVACWIGKIT
ncbi:MAG: purine-nucleoside phosphorylase [Acidobacteria bacterium]|nr:purine-nucleoside phosphorylase [Acidobacteriota bacterium]